MNKIVGLFFLMIAPFFLNGQTSIQGKDYVLLVRLATKQNTVDYMQKKLEDPNTKESTKERFRADLDQIDKLKAEQFKDICRSMENQFSGSVYYILDSEMKDWDRSSAPQVYAGNPLEVKEKLTLDKPFLLVATGDFTMTRLTEKGLVVLDNEFSTAEFPFGMRKTVKARGDSFMTFSSTEKQWDKIASYLFDHLNKNIAQRSIVNEEYRNYFNQNLLFNN